MSEFIAQFVLLLCFFAIAVILFVTGEVADAIILIGIFSILVELYKK